MQLAEDTDISLLPQLIDTFINTAEQQIGVIIVGTAEADFQNVAAAAHSLKSSSATFGAFYLNELVKTIEAASKEKDAALLTDTVPLMDSEGSVVFRKLREYAEQICPE